MASAWADGPTATFRVPEPGYRLALARLTAWRDGFDPHLTRLICRVCR